jgi:thiol-disulfide isomerase/thioredoxin
MSSRGNYKLYSELSVSETNTIKQNEEEQIQKTLAKAEKKPQINTKMVMLQGKSQQVQGFTSLVSYLQNNVHLEKSLKDPSNIVVVCATAKWCKPCEALAPKFSNFAGLHLDCIFHKDDIDSENSVHRPLVSSVPTFFVYYNNNRTLISGLDFDKMTNMVKQLKLERTNKTSHMAFRN